MSRAQDIVEKIRRCLQHYGGNPIAEGAEIAHEYAEVVDQVNKRLETCVGLLRKGMRTEAMHLAELSPNLFDEAITLDFPEWQDWAILCDQAGFGRAVRVNDQAVVELDEALPDEQQLADLLNKHRLLALGRAPLRSRIKVLQRLSQEDIGSPIWGEDLVTFEKERHKQIHEEAHRAERKGDLAKIESLNNEVNGGWVNQPPSSLAKRVSEAWQRVKAKEASAGLAKLRDTAHQALANADPVTLEPALAKLRDAASHLDRLDRETKDLVTSASHWLDDYYTEQQTQSDFEASVRALEHALDNEEPIQNLDRKWASVSSYDRAVPDAILRRYESRMREAQIESKRKFRLKLVAVVGVLGIVAAVVAMLVMHMAEQRQLQRWVTQVDLLVADEKWKDADKMLAGIQIDQPGIYSTPEILERAKQVTTELEKETIRSQEFEDIYKQLEQGLAVATENRTSYENQDLLEKLSELAKTPEENRRASEIGRRIDALQASLQAEIDKQAMQSLELLRERFAEIQEHLKNETKGLDGLLQDIKAVQDELLALGKDDTLSNNASGALQVFQVSVKSVSQNIESKHKNAIARSQMIAKIKSEYADPTALVKLYQEFTASYPNDPYTKDFASCVAKADQWAAIVAWSQATSSVKDLRPTDVDDANTLLETSREYLRSHSADFMGSAVKHYSDYLKRAKIGLATNTRPSAKGSFLDRQVLSDRALSLFTLKSGEGDVFYLAKEDIGQLTKTDSKILIQYVQSVNPLSGQVVERRQWYPRNQFIEPLAAKRSAQYSFLDASKKWLEDNPTQWHDAHLSILNTLLSTTQIDPIYKAKLASQLVWLSRNNDAIELPALGEWYEGVRSLDLDASWLDPNEDLDELRRQADEALGDIPPISILKTELDKTLATLFEDVARRVPAALILKREDGSLEFTTPIKDLPSGRFEVLMRSGTSWKLETFLELSEGQAPRIKAVSGGIPSGAIVFHVLDSQP